MLTSFYQAFAFFSRSQTPPDTPGKVNTLRQRQPKRFSAATLVPHVCVADAHVDVCMRVRACMSTSMHMYT